MSSLLWAFDTKVLLVLQIKPDVDLLSSSFDKQFCEQLVSLVSFTLVANQAADEAGRKVLLLLLLLVER